MDCDILSKIMKVLVLEGLCMNGFVEYLSYGTTYRVKILNKFSCYSTVFIKNCFKFKIFPEYYLKKSRNNF